MSNNTNTVKSTVFVDALRESKRYKSMRITGEVVGVANALAYKNALLSVWAEAYKIRYAQHINMGKSASATMDKTAYYNAVKSLLSLIGEVNGDTLNTKNVAEELLSEAITYRTIATSDEMSHAYNMRQIARKAFKSGDGDEDTYTHWANECKRLEALPDNAKKIPVHTKETAFVSKATLYLADAVTSQEMKSYDEVVAEREARKAAQAERRKARKDAKKQAEKSAK